MLDEGMSKLAITLLNIYASRHVQGGLKIGGHLKIFLV